MPAKNDRIIIDTNLWISYLLSDKLVPLDELINEKKITLLFSKKLIDEFIEVASRSKFKKYFTRNDLDDLLIQLSVVSEFINVTTTVNIWGDAKDNFLLALAKDGNATFLITGDKDLLSVKIFGDTRVVTFADFFSKR